MPDQDEQPSRIRSVWLPTTSPPVTGAAIRSVASAKPSDIQQVAAAQLDVSNGYYFAVLRQAERSFFAALVAAGVGLVFFVFAVVSARSVGVSVAGMSAGAGAVVETIAGLNFWLFTRTKEQLDTFHRRNDRIGRFLLASDLPQ